MKKRIVHTILIFLGTLLVLAVLLLAAILIAEYRPEAEEDVDIVTTEDDMNGGGNGTLEPGDDVRILTWNMGYGALGESADFFMDGGSHVFTADETEVRENVSAVIDELTSEKPEIIFLQEVDQDSSRSHHVDEVSDIREAMDGYQSTFANNYKALYVPYPWPPMGKVDSGILTLSEYPINDSVRISLPNPFHWPARACNLKRCLLVDRIAVEGTDKELILVNLHLEAYDDGEGKKAQTKQLRELLETEQAKGNYVIAGGDFNQTFSNVDSSMYPTDENLWVPGVIDISEFGNSFDFLMDNSTPTCRSLDQPYAGADADTFHYYMIDGFIVSDNLEVHGIETKDLGFRNSDHNPVILQVKLEA